MFRVQFEEQGKDDSFTTARPLLNPPPRLGGFRYVRLKAGEEEGWE